MTPLAIAQTYNELMGPEHQVKSVEIQYDGHSQTIYVNMILVRMRNQLPSANITLNVPEK